MNYIHNGVDYILTIPKIGLGALVSSLYGAPALCGVPTVLPLLYLFRVSPLSQNVHSKVSFRSCEFTGRRFWPAKLPPHLNIFQRLASFLLNINHYLCLCKEIHRALNYHQLKNLIGNPSNSVMCHL